MTASVIGVNNNKSIVKRVGHSKYLGGRMFSLKHSIVRYILPGLNSNIAIWAQPLERPNQ